MSRARPSPRRSLAVLLVLLSLVAAINVAAAATLNVQAGKLSAFDQPVVRCAPAVPLGKIDNDTATVAMVGYDVPANCVGETAHTTLYGSGGSPLGSGTGTVTSPSFTIPLAPTASLANYFGTALAVGGLQVGVGGSNVTLHIQINDWSDGYCGDVTLSNGSPTSISRSVPVALNQFPLNGTMGNTWGAVSSSSPAQFSIGGTVPANGSLAGGFCASRDGVPVEPGDVDVVVVPRNQTTTSYCADVTVTNNGAAPATWEVEVDVSDHHQYGRGYGTMNSHWSAIASYDDTSIITASGTGWTEQIPPGESREWGYCMQDLQPLPTDPGEGPSFTYTVVVLPEDHWGNGYEGTVTVFTDSTDPVPWNVQVNLAEFGVTNSVTAWGVNGSYATPILMASGSPGTSTELVSDGNPVSFQFGASNVSATSPRNPGATVLTETWNGNCATVDVTSSSSTWHAWEAQIDLSGRNGNPKQFWGPVGGNTRNFDNQTRLLTVWGTSDGWQVTQGKTQQFGFCL